MEPRVKTYQVVRRGAYWHVHIPDSTAGVHPSQEKSHMIDWACDAAQRIDGRVVVFDRGGQVERVYSYVDGVQAAT